DLHGLSEELDTYDLLHEEHRIPTFDGVTLAADVWRADLPNRTFPVVAIISPYFAGAKQRDDNNYPDPDSTYAAYIDWFLPRGYAVALVDLRGTRSSGGCVDLGGPKEQADAATVVDFLGQLPWSNGKVGMIGGSYDGWTQQMAAANTPKHLAAIIPIAPVADWYHVVGKGGAKYQGWTPHSPLLYNYEIGVNQHDPYDIDHLTHQHCLVVNQAGSNDFTGDYNAWMRERDIREKAKDARAPMLYVHGFADVNARPDHIDPWYNNYGGPKRGFLWQMDHAQPNAANTGRGDDFRRLAIQWMDYHLLGLPNGINGTYGLVEVQDNFGRWRLETSWPPADLVETRFALAPGAIHIATNDTPAPTRSVGGLLGLGLATQAETMRLRDNPFEDGQAFGARDARMESTASDSRLVFRSGVLEEDIHYAGRPAVHLRVEADRPQAQYVVRLYDVSPDGSWTLLNRGVATLRHRNGPDTAEAAAPATLYTVKAAMQPNDYVFPKGHAIGITVTASDMNYVYSSPAYAMSTVHFDGAEGSALVLPVIARDTFTETSWGGDQPSWMGPREEARR
ncbi:MAG TPA: CocE/NonD family hydrolase, partial [Candidatus Thermoplasmatota archaeon]|nr:CocE/NonD family hydrolase [Candidatus Thermoplasmatota archaeon]